MPRNESIIAVPIVLETFGQTRQFLVRLVEKLDIVLGNRGGDPYVSSSQLDESQTAGLSELERTILSVIETLLASSDSSLTDLIEEAVADTDAAVNALKSPDTITNGNTTTETFSAPPTKSEVEALAARVTTNATRFNDLLDALRATGIIAT